jgi:transcription factor SPT20
VIEDKWVLRRHRGKPPSLVVHLHPHHFRFDAQDSVFSYSSPMRIFIQHLRTRTIPLDLLDQFVQSGVSFYDGCLIVQVHDHKTVANTADAARPTSSSNAPDPSTLHRYSNYLTPSPYGTIPKDQLPGGGKPKAVEELKESKTEEDDENNESKPTPLMLPEKSSTSKSPAKAKVITLVLHPPPETLQRDLLIQAYLQHAGKGAVRSGLETPGVVPPSTPLFPVPPTPTASSMPPPAKRQKRDKSELDSTNITAAEGQILLATQAPLHLGPACKSVEEQITLLEATAHPHHSDGPPQPKARKRTVAEVEADQAAAAEQERYLLALDDRNVVIGAQTATATDGDAQAGAATFEPRFERFKVIAEIQRDHVEKKEQEKIKQQENDRRLQLQRQQQQQEQAALAAQQRQQQAEAEKARREAAAREAQARQAAEQQRQAMAARAAAAAPTPVPPPTTTAVPPPQHAHPNQNNGMQNGMVNGVQGGQSQGVPNMQGQAQHRFQAQMQQAQASSPVIRQGTPQNHSSPMVNASVPMQQTSSTMAASPPRPASVVQNPPMSVPMSHNMSARGSQQSHPSGTPRIPHSTPNMGHGTPINRQAMSATPRMSQASPPPNMMAQNSQMGQTMMMNNPNMTSQMVSQMAAQQRAIAAQQAQQAGLGNNGMQNGGMQTPGMQNGMNAQQQMLMMQRQLMAQQQQQQQQMQMQQQQHQQGGMPSQQQLHQQYAQQVQNMQSSHLRMNPQMQAQMMARMQAQQQQQQAQQQMGGHNMQRQATNQMMNGNMQAMMQMQQMQQQAAAQRQQQQQQQQQAQQMNQQPQQQHMNQQPPQQQQQQQPQQVMQPQINPLHAQIQNIAKNLYQKTFNDMASKYGSRESVPHEVVEGIKHNSLQQAQAMVRQTMVNRQLAQQQQQQQQLLMQQQQNQQQQHMQGMGGMMGHQQM